MVLSFKERIALALEMVNDVRGPHCVHYTVNVIGCSGMWCVIWELKSWDQIVTWSFISFQAEQLHNIQGQVQKEMQSPMFKRQGKMPLIKPFFLF
jgi:hypothetical protein